MGQARLRWNLAEWFILAQTFIPALLYLPGSQPLRVPIRVASYGLSLGALVYYWLVARPKGRSKKAHPASAWLIAAMAYLGLMLVHPNTNSLLAGSAQIALYFAVLSPLIWAPSFVENSTRLNRLLWLLLICNGINSFVGVMQVQDPNRWMPKEFSSVYAESEYGLGTVIYEGAGGNFIIRPPGLGDAPGAVAMPAAFALVLGLVFVVSAKVWWQRILAGGFAVLGAAAVFLTLVRSSLLIAVGEILIYFLLLLAQKRFQQAIALMLVAVAAITLAFLHSASVGGESLTARFHSIFEEDPMTFYYENRGNQVEEGFMGMLPKYPMGAGLGRWGMMNLYFGNQANVSGAPIWVEIQVPAWIVDGGIVLLLLYPVAIALALLEQGRIALNHRDASVRRVAGIIFAANTGLVALCSSYPVFAAPVGMQFWFLAGALHGLTRRGPFSNDNRNTTRRPVAVGSDHHQLKAPA